MVQYFTSFILLLYNQPPDFQNRVRHPGILKAGWSHVLFLPGELFDDINEPGHVLDRLFEHEVI